MPTIDMSGALWQLIILSSNAQWESARPNLDLPKIEARGEVSA